MKVKTFPRGVHPSDNKNRTADLAIVAAPIPKEIILPLQQHAGVICEPVVTVGDQVSLGQKIADSDAAISAPIHTPVSGKVKAIALRPHHSGIKQVSVVIEPLADQPSWEPKKPEHEPGVDEIRRLVREAGIVGLGGAVFPTQIKISPPPEAVIDSVIINGCECEPYLTVDHRLMIERPGEILDGLALLMKTVGAEAGYVGVEINKPDAIAAMSALAQPLGIEVVPLEVKYPQGAEKQLIHAILNREIASGSLPSSVGALVQNVGTAVAVSEAIRGGRPLISRAVTVSGSAVKDPKNLNVLIGTPISDLIEACSGLADSAAKVILGGPMMGVAVADLQAPVVKATSGVIALTESEVSGSEYQPCIKCGRCVEACPMTLMPNRLSALAEVSIWDEMEDESIFDCVECGSCSFVCPSKRPLVHHIRLGKYELMRERERSKGA